MGSRSRYGPDRFPLNPSYAKGQTQAELWNETHKASASTVPKIVRGGTWVRGGTLAVVASEAPLINLYFPEACTIAGVEITTVGGTGSCVVDIWNDTYANLPNTVADTITAAAKPTISSGVKYKDTTLTGWDKTVTADSVLSLKLDSTSSFTSISVFLTLALT